MERVCGVCQKIFHVRPSFILKGRGKYCCRKCYGEASKTENNRGEYKGCNLFSSSLGYLRIVLDNGVTMLFHRYLVEEVLGRPLLRTEHVHHINEDVTDNRLENLVVLSQAEHARAHSDIRITNLGGVPGQDTFCPDCKKVMPISQFNSNTSSCRKHGSICSSCDALRSRLYRKSHGDVVRQKDRERHKRKVRHNDL